jgi:hypothetical protein
MNDPSEFFHGIDQTIDTARLMAPSGDKEPVQRYCKILASMIASPKVAHENFSFFIASFSRHRDDLGQWRSYADNGKGYAIGFGASAFQTDTKKPVPPNEAVAVGPVNYDMAINERRIAAVIDKAAEVLLKAHTQKLLEDDHTKDQFMQELARQSLASPLIWYALTSKNASYKCEDEVRLIMLGQRAPLLKFTKTRVRGSEIVPYVPYAMPMRRLPHLLEIIVGPVAGEH